MNIVFKYVLFVFLNIDYNLGSALGKVTVSVSLAALQLKSIVIGWWSDGKSSNAVYFIKKGLCLHLRWFQLMISKKD